jgi:hypothetical protein
MQIFSEFQKLHTSSQIPPVARMSRRRVIVVVVVVVV